MGERTLSVYVIHYNAPDWCRATVDSLLASDGVDVKVEVLHNGGPLPDVDPRARIRETGANIGFAGAANVALRSWLVRTEDPYCVVAAHDLTVKSDTLRLMADAADLHPDVGLLGPTPDHDIATGPAIAEEEWGVIREWVSGACLMIRRKLLDDVGLFDERLHSYAEDRDLAYRARTADWSVATVKGAYASGKGKVSLTSYRQMYANQIALVFKYQGTAKALREAVAQLGLGIRHTLAAVNPLPRSWAARKRQAIRGWAALTCFASAVRRCRLLSYEPDANPRRRG